MRRYGEAAVALLGFIRRAQDVGFALDEVRTLLILGETPNCRGARTLAARKLEVVQRLRELQRVRRALAELTERCDAGMAAPVPDKVWRAHPRAS